MLNFSLWRPRILFVLQIFFWRAQVKIEIVFDKGETKLVYFYFFIKFIVIKDKQTKNDIPFSSEKKIDIFFGPAKFPTTFILPVPTKRTNNQTNKTNKHQL